MPASPSHSVRLTTERNTRDLGERITAPRVSNLAEPMEEEHSPAR